MKEASIEIGMKVRLPKFGKAGTVWEIDPQAGPYEKMVVVVREEDGREIEVHPREITAIHEPEASPDWELADRLDEVDRKIRRGSW